MWNCNNPYEFRADSLRTLGFASYRDYLKSDLWISIKARAIRAARNKCARCGSGERLQVHHRTYDLKTMAGGTLDGLTVACRRCHCAAEQPKSGRSAHDRLSGANEYMTLTAQSPLEWAWRWYKRYWRWGHPCETPEEAYAVVESIKRRVATSVAKNRCIVCRRLDMAAPVQIQEGLVCGFHIGSQRFDGIIKAIHASL